MDILYAPWRQKYAKQIVGKTENTTAEECVFCTKVTLNDDGKHYILRRSNYNIIALNLFPYNAGHLLIIPYAHVAQLEQLEKEARSEMMELVNESSSILQQQLGAQGINIGLNLGKAAGAGIPAHLHVHVLPRWAGDTNFLPLLAQTKNIAFDLNEVYKDLKPLFKNNA